jgi:chitosanase
MSDTFSDTIPCEDCDEHARYLAYKYEVLGCRQDPKQPGACVIEYRRKDAGQPAGAPAAAAMGAAAAQAGKPAAAASPPVLAKLKSPAFHTAPAAPEAAAVLLPLQAAAAKAIVNLFETGEVLGEYGAVTVLAGDRGHLTYGRSQTTLGSGNLALLLEMYGAAPGARFAGRILPWLPKLRERDTTLDREAQLHNVLRACADDPVMRDVQDRFFDEAYWNRALLSAAGEGITLPLGIAIVYDSWVHGSWAAMRDRTRALATVQAAGEESWLRRYVATRREWLAGHDNPLLRKTVYRMDAFQRLMDQGYWGLPLPLVVRGREISLASLSAQPPGCYDGPQPGTRAVAVETPFLRGLDVRLLQLGLSDRGYEVRADGIYGNTSAGLVRTFQQAAGLPSSGVADPDTIARLVT